MSIFLDSELTENSTDKSNGVEFEQNDLILQENEEHELSCGNKDNKGDEMDYVVEAQGLRARRNLADDPRYIKMAEMILYRDPQGNESLRPRHGHSFLPDTERIRQLYDEVFREECEKYSEYFSKKLTK